MKYLSSFFVFIVINVGISKAQDLIVTTMGDSLNCKITKVTTNEILFTRRNNGRVVKTQLPVMDIKMYEKDYYLSKNRLFSTGKSKPKYEKFTISPYGGWSYLIAKTSSSVPNDLKTYINELRSGYHVGAELTYFISEKIGVGLKYVNFNTSNETFIFVTQSGQTKNGVMRDKITTHFIAPVIATRSLSFNQKTIVSSNFSIGYLGYKNDATLMDDFKLTGSTAGIGLDFGVEQKFSKTFGLELKLGAVAGSLGKLIKTDGFSTQTIKLPKEQRENISRIDVSLGFKWHY